MKEKITLTWQEAVEKWKKGEGVWCVELGGIGPGYEQAIQILLWEIIARWNPEQILELVPENKTFPEIYSNHVDRVVQDLDKECGGFSGAQVGAAKVMAYQFMAYGYAEMMNKCPDDRQIFVAKFFPNVISSPVKMASKEDQEKTRDWWV